MCSALHAYVKEMLSFGKILVCSFFSWKKKWSCPNICTNFRTHANTAVMADCWFILVFEAIAWTDLNRNKQINVWIMLFHRFKSPKVFQRLRNLLLLYLFLRFFTFFRPFDEISKRKNSNSEFQVKKELMICIVINLE